MPRLPINYQDTIIYKLVHKDDFNNENIYIGHTTRYTTRKCKHKMCCNNEKMIEYNEKKYQYIRSNGGWDEWNMREVEKYPCNDSREAEAREEYWRVYFNSHLNSKKAFRTDEELKEYNTKYFKERYEREKEAVLKYQQEKLKCECGCIIGRGNMRDHKKTKKHIDLMLNSTNIS